MNEGHAALLGIGLLEERLGDASLDQATEEDIAAIAQLCVFTTHTPVPAGHDQFGADLMYSVLGAERSKTIERFGCLHNSLLNMTYLALRFSRYVNGVALQHGKVSHEMFPDYPVHSITNQTGDVRQARTAPATQAFWQAWRTIGAIRNSHREKP